MNRISCLNQIELDLECTEKIAEFKDFLPDLSENYNFFSVLKHKKLENYKKILNVGYETLGSLQDFMSIQHELVEKIKHAENTYNSTINDIEKIQIMYNSNAETKNKLKVVEKLILSTSLNKVVLEECIDRIENCEVLIELYRDDRSIHVSYTNELIKAKLFLVNELKKQTAEKLLEIKDLSKNLVIKKSFQIIKKYDTKGFENLEIQFIKQRKHVCFMIIKNLDFSLKTSESILKTVVKITKSEENLLKYLFDSDPTSNLQKIFNENSKIIKSFIVSKQFIHKLPILLQLLSLLDTKSSPNLIIFNEIKQELIRQFESYILKLSSNISSLSGLQLSKCPYLLKIIVSEIYFSLKICQNNPNLIRYQETLNNELVFKIFGYFYDLENLKLSIISLKIFEMLNDWIGEFYASICVSIENIKEKIVEFEVERIISKYFPKANSDSVNIFNFFYSLVSDRILSNDLDLIEKSNEDLKSKISESLFSQIISFTKNSKFSLVSPSNFKFLLT